MRRPEGPAEVDGRLAQAGFGITMSTKEVAHALRCSRHTVIRRADSGHIPVCRPDGGHPFFERFEVARYIATTRVTLRS